MENIKLKPCPFCGAKARFSHAESEGLRGPCVESVCVVCENCEAMAGYANDYEHKGDLESVAAEGWNRRADNGTR